jgi:hypothetical protein
MTKSKNIITGWTKPEDTGDQSTDAVTQFFQMAYREYERFKTDREAVGFDEQMEVNDGMYKAFRNRDLADADQNAYVDDAASEDDNERPTRASVGSIRFFKLVNQRASLGDSIVNSVDVPWRYKPIANPHVWPSAQEAADQTAIHNVLGRYAWKRGQCTMRSFEFWQQIYKYGCVPIAVEWRHKTRRLKVIDMNTGKPAWKDVIAECYPAWRVLSWSMVYLDIYAGPIENQTTVVVMSVVPWRFIEDGVKNKWYDAATVEKLQAAK